MKTVLFQGMTVRLDRPKGFVQEGKDKSGTPWKRVYKNDYGFLPKTQGGDGEGVDIFLGDHPEAPMAYWFTQKKDDGSFDEYKVVLGASSQSEARKIYTDHIPRKFLGAAHAMSVEMMKAMLGYEPDVKTAMWQSFVAELQKISSSTDLVKRVVSSTLPPTKGPTDLSKAKGFFGRAKQILTGDRADVLAAAAQHTLDRTNKGLAADRRLMKTHMDNTFRITHSHPRDARVLAAQKSEAEMRNQAHQTLHHPDRKNAEPTEAMKDRAKKLEDRAERFRVAADREKNRPERVAQKASERATDLQVKSIFERVKSYAARGAIGGVAVGGTAASLANKEKHDA